MAVPILGLGPKMKSRARRVRVPVQGAPGVASALPAGITDTVEYMNRQGLSAKSTLC